MDLFKQVNEQEFKTIKFKNQRRNLYSKKRQTGSVVLERDKKREALLPGKRISKTGKTYYEYRKNRSDLKTKRV